MPFFIYFTSLQTLNNKCFINSSVIGASANTRQQQPTNEKEIWIFIWYLAHCLHLFCSIRVLTKHKKMLKLHFNFTIYLLIGPSLAFRWVSPGKWILNKSVFCCHSLLILLLQAGSATTAERDTFGDNECFYIQFNRHNSLITLEKVNCNLRFTIEGNWI